MTLGCYGNSDTDCDSERGAELEDQVGFCQTAGGESTPGVGLRGADDYRRGGCLCGAYKATGGSGVTSASKLASVEVRVVALKRACKHEFSGVAMAGGTSYTASSQACFGGH